MTGHNLSMFCTGSPVSENQPSQNQWPSAQPRLALLEEAFSSRGVRKLERLQDHYSPLSPTSYPHTTASLPDNSTCHCRLTSAQLVTISNNSSHPFYPGLCSRRQRK